MPPSGMRRLVALAALCALFAGVQPSADILKDVTLGFGEALKHCRDESQLTEDQMEEFFHIWRDDFVFEHRELGCAIYCMSRYFNLLTDTNRAHHENIHKFIESFENGEVLAKRMVEIIHECEHKFDHEDDHCWRILHMSECFKKTVIAEGIAPSIEMILAEIIMEADG